MKMPAIAGIFIFISRKNFMLSWVEYKKSFIVQYLILSYVSSDASIPILTVLSTSLGKTFFAWHFILNENILFWLTLSYQKPFVFSVSVFDFQICTRKLNLSPEIGLPYAISIVKWFFGIFVLVNIVYFSLLNLNYWCFTTILWKFQKNWTSETC